MVKERAPTVGYCIRYHLDSLVQHEELVKLLKSKSSRWFWGRHQTERPHLHWYIETDMREQALRSVFQRFRKSAKDTRWYSVSTMRSTIEQYGSYVMLKPETEETDMLGISEEEVEGMVKYADKCKDAVKEDKKSKSVIALLNESKKYCSSLTVEQNFNEMYDWLVDNGLYNMYTEIKMMQIFGMWKARSDKVDSREEYRKIRAKFAYFVCEKFSC